MRPCSESARRAAGLTDGLLRLSVGIEALEDLRADLAAGAGALPASRSGLRAGGQTALPAVQLSARGASVTARYRMVQHVEVASPAAIGR